MSADLTVVMAVRDGADWIERAVASAAEADGLLEVLVVDDGSSDESAALAATASDAVRVITQPPTGLPAAHNAGLREARGDLVAFLDADDLWAASTPDPRRELLQGADAVLGRIQCLADGGPYAEPFHNGGIAGLLAKRSAFDEPVPFDESLQHGHDLDWYLRARERGIRIMRSNEVSLYYSLRPGSLSHAAGGRTRGLLAALSKSTRRRGGVT